MFLISAGRPFHSLGAADCKARSPSVGKHHMLAGTCKIAFLDLRLYLHWAATSGGRGGGGGSGSDSKIEVLVHRGT